MTPTDPGPQRSAESHSASAPYAGDDGFQGGAHGGAGWPGAEHDSGDAITGPLVSNLLCAVLGCSSANAVAPGEAGQARVSHGQHAVEMAAALTFAKYLGAVAGVIGGELGAGAAARGTGAFAQGVQGGAGLGKFGAGHPGLRVSEKGLAIVESHLAQFGNVPQNTAMIGRLQAALQSGSRIHGADAIFYTHEAAEATMMGRGMTYEAAHGGALGKYGVSPFSVYHPSVISAYPAQFNSAWFAFWGL